MLESVPFTEVTIDDTIWSPRQKTNREVTTWHCLEMLEKAGNLSNFRLAAAGAHEGYRGPRYMDSDLYKTLEGISYCLATHPDTALEARVDEIIALIGSAQMADGYINTHFQVNAPDKRWTNLRDAHELYCAGHLIEAAVAHFQATSKRSLLDIALKFCELIWKEFGPDGRPGYPGHPEIELALVRLWKVTGDQRWFDLAKLFIDRRGSGYFAREHGQSIEEYDGSYWIDDAPVRELEGLKGHAVRAAYLLSAAVDVASNIEDSDYLIDNTEELWSKVIETSTYITGGIGSSGANEGFTRSYDLPNDTAYQETCASIAMAMWGSRLSHYFADGKYFDAVETALYNAVLSGIGLDGRSFFYDNPLASGPLAVGGIAIETKDSLRRQPWFECACCPPNILRTLASIGGYAYAKSQDSLFVNLFIGGTVRTKVGEGNFEADIRTNYPWSGRILIDIKADTSVDICLRVPAWCRNYTISASNEQRRKPNLEDGYLRLRGPWKKDDQIMFTLEMPVEHMLASYCVVQDFGLVAIKRGPLVYCVEQLDTDIPLAQVTLPFSKGWANPEHPVLKCPTVEVEAAWHDCYQPLYRPMSDDMQTSLRLIPYAFWANREPTAMRVWMPR